MVEVHQALGEVPVEGEGYLKSRLSLMSQELDKSLIQLVKPTRYRKASGAKGYRNIFVLWRMFSEL